jgi:hypothetical protein
MKEENKLIAEFMGMESFKDMLSTLNNGKINISIDIYEQAKYHSSWDWLMPVIEKIDEICGIDLHEWDEYINNSLCSKSLNTTYSACIEFIKWYNKNN